MALSRRFTATLVIAAALPALVAAQDRVAPRPNTRQVVQELRRVSISPTGQAVAWFGAYVGNGSSQRLPPALYVTDLGSPESPPQRITAGSGHAYHDERGATWSPDGRHIAFLSDAVKSGERPIYVLPAAGGAARRLTKVVQSPVDKPRVAPHPNPPPQGGREPEHGSRELETAQAAAISDLRWSPDGKQIGFLFIENPSRAAGPTAAVPPQTGVIGEKIFEQRLGVVDVTTGQTRILSPADLYVYEYAWSPDSANIAVIAAHGSGDNNWYVAQLYTLAVTSGEIKSILKTSMQIATPAWSPDGKSIAFVGGLMSDEGVIGGDIFAIPATGGTPRNLTADIQASPCWLTWLASGRILFTEHIDGGSGVATVDPDTGSVDTLWTGSESIAAESRNCISVTGDGKTSALVRQSFDKPPELWTGPIGAWKPVTHLNDRVTPQCGKAQSLHWKSDEFTVQGWLLYPSDYDEKRRYPMVVMVHGGPASQLQPTFPSGRSSAAAEFSRSGYFVFLPNPRGSYGQGEKFTRANVKDFGHGDLRDILSGVDEILKTLPVDGNRLGITGWSYGGYMTMWAVTQTTRFRAAVAGAGIANWQSYYGENGIDQWLIPYFGASVYDDPAVYAKSSPINFIKKVKTPTLILVGEYDVECPVPQSYEFWHALKTLNVPTEFVVYPKEGHGIGRPDHQRDIMRRMRAWFDKYLRDGMR